MRAALLKQLERNGSLQESLERIATESGTPGKFRKAERSFAQHLKQVKTNSGKQDL
jgi:hypothetical protein